ncbi:MAG TPA: NYN domain-containing protein [Actinotalea caeni]|uniref:NYN domain-containing protein n=1 Tax=Actinotalea caeni TaxID=1348467 RepID=UPI002B4AD4C7|nr:NYN domain-containing protein [Actinotalea caeni]HLV56970.1 NYN domain-containing protein [Actinotalea caeni]
MDDEDRIALFLDYENLALGARDHLGASFDLRPIADALAERGRVVARRAYADWSYFDEDRRMLTRAHVELIEMPQRMGASRKNAADIKMAVDAIELAFSRDYVSTFAICTGDSDFTPLVHKLRELNKRVIGVGVRHSTSAMLPPACDEFLYYDDLAGLESQEPPRRRGRGGKATSSSTPDGGATTAAPAAPSAPSPAEPVADTETDDGAPTSRGDIAVLVAQTVAGLEQSSGSGVTASLLKRTLLRKDSTFNEADYGFRAFGELVRHLADRGVLDVSDGPAQGDPVVRLSERGSREEAFGLLRAAVEEVGKGQPVPLSGLKDHIRRDNPDFTEKTFGYRSFLQFSRAAETAGVITLEKNDDGYLVRPA